jgi:hypothetical protein
MLMFDDHCRDRNLSSKERQVGGHRSASRGAQAGVRAVVFLLAGREKNAVALRNQQLKCHASRRRQTRAIARLTRAVREFAARVRTQKDEIEQFQFSGV